MLSTIRIYAKRAIGNLSQLEYIQVSNYARWSHRRPVRVLAPEEYEKENVGHLTRNEDIAEKNEMGNESVQKINWRYSQNKLEGLSEVQQQLKSVKKNKRTKAKIESTDMLLTVIDNEGQVVYTKMANHDQRISQLMTTVKVKNERAKKNLILLEGKRLIHEALINKCRLKYLLFSRKDDLEGLKPDLPKSGALIYKMPLREMQLWSDLTHCPGIMGVFEHPSIENFTPSNDLIPLTVVCDNIREPGNLGSILRVCAGVGCRNVILTKGCCNLWDTKVTRSGCGAHFRLQIHSKLEWPEIKEKLKNNRVFMADNNALCSSSSSVDDILPKIQQIPLLPYYGVSFNGNEEVGLIIGGETEGLSEEAYDLVHEAKGGRLNIPLGNGVESLNAGVAAGVILFEIRKQIAIEKMNKSVAFGLG